MFGAPAVPRQSSASATPPPSASPGPANAAPGAAAGPGGPPLPVAVAGAGDDPSKFAERAIPVIEAVQGVLNHLTAVKARMEDPIKPRIFLDSTIATVLKAIAKKFPDAEPGNQLPNYGMFTTYAKEVIDTFEEPFRAMARVIEVLDYAQALLFGAAPLVLGGDVPELIEIYMRLLVGYVKINLYVNKLEDRKLAVAAYARASGLMPRANSGMDQMLYKRISDYLVKFDNPIEGMQAEFEKYSPRIGEVLAQLKPWVDAAVMPVNQLRQEGLLNIIHIPLDIKKPSSEDRRLRAMSHVLEVVEWAYYGYLIVPAEMTKPGGIELLKSIFNFGFVNDLNHADFYFFHPEFEAAAGKAKAARSAAQEGALAAVQSSGALHADRRDFARMNLTQILNLLRDKPGLVLPKISLILASLGFARDEVLWFFRHVEQTPPNARKAKMNANDYTDYQLPELLYLIEQVRLHVLQHKKAIGSYYAQYLSGYYLNKTREEAKRVDPHLDDYLRKQLIGIVDTLKLLDPNNLATARLEGFRMNWKRTQTYLSLPGPRERQAFGPLCKVMDEIVARTRYIDTLEATLASCAGLHDLYHHRVQFVKALDQCTRQVYQSRYVEAFLTIIQQMPATVVPGFGRELAVVGPKIVTLMDEALTSISRRIGECAQEWTQSWVGFCEQGSLDRVIVYVKQDRDAKDGRLVDKRGQPLPREPRPGSESNMRPDASNMRVHGLKMMMTNLCKAMGGNTIAVHDAVYSPSYYLLDTLVGNARTWLTAVLKPTEEQSGLIRRPSSLLTAVEAYIFALQVFDNRSGVDIQTLLRDLLLDNIDLSKAKKLQMAAEQAEQMNPGMSLGTLGNSLVGGLGTVRRAGTMSRKDKGQVLMPSVPAGDFGSILYIYGSWYAELASTRFINGVALAQEPYTNRLPATSAVYSEARKLFTSSKASYVKIEKYADLYELMRLAELVGSNGLIVIEDRLTKPTSKLADDIRSLILTVRGALDLVAANFNSALDSKAILDPIKLAITQFDALLDRVLALGVLFSFTDLIAETVQKVTSRRVPRLYTAIENAHMQLPTNYVSAPKIVSLDNLANQVGIYSKVDASFTRIMRNTGSLEGDRRLWEYLPVVFAVFLTMVANNEASAYNMATEVYDSNIGVLAKTFIRLVNAALPPVSVSAGQKTSDNPAVADAHRKFVQIGATILMRMMKDPQRPPQLDTAIILLDKFVAMTKYVTFEMFNRIMPYPLVRLAYAEMHRKFSKRKGLKSGPEESAFA